MLDFSKLRKSKNQEHLVKNALENDLKLKCDSELDFFKILVDFGAILGAKIGPKWKKNEIKKRCDFKTKLGDRMALLKPSSLVRDRSLAA